MGTISSAASRIRKGVVPVLTTDGGTDRAIRIGDDGLLYWKQPGASWVRMNGLAWFGIWENAITILADNFSSWIDFDGIWGAQASTTELTEDFSTW